VNEKAREWPALLAIVGVFAAGWWLVGARADVPVIDDWVYAWSVQHLIDTGRLQVLDISAFYPIVQVLWGALFARIAGFSFGVLRVSTLILAVLGCWAVYLTLRELGCRWGTSLLGALALALDPVYFALSFSFMTEIPFVSLSAMALYWYVRAGRRNERAAVWAGCACAVAAFLIRPIGIVLPLALVPTLVWTREWRRALRSHAAPLAVALVVMGTLQWQMPRLLGPLRWAGIREGYLQWWFTIPVGTYVRWNVEALFVAVFPFAPLLLAYATRRRHAIAVGAAAIGLALICRLTLGALGTSPRGRCSMATSRRPPGRCRRFPRCSCWALWSPRRSASSACVGGCVPSDRRLRRDGSRSSSSRLRCSRWCASTCSGSTTIATISCSRRHWRSRGRGRWTVTTARSGWRRCC
jgi:4-amino-4-deoxy-L-arabinose transferase-like glycosyltransferase